jgi:hypothetical protein
MNAQRGMSSVSRIARNRPGDWDASDSNPAMQTKTGRITFAWARLNRGRWADTTIYLLQDNCTPEQQWRAVSHKKDRTNPCGTILEEVSVGGCHKMTDVLSLSNRKLVGGYDSLASALGVATACSADSDCIAFTAATDCSLATSEASDSRFAGQTNVRTRQRMEKATRSSC